MTHWWGLISPKCAKGGRRERERERERGTERGTEREREREREGERDTHTVRREGGDGARAVEEEDKCNGLAIKRKVDGMHRQGCPKHGRAGCP